VEIINKPYWSQEITDLELRGLAGIPVRRVEEIPTGGDGLGETERMNSCMGARSTGRMTLGISVDAVTGSGHS